MSQDISGFGLKLRVVASVTFPVLGFEVSQFADDADPFDAPSLKIAGSSMGVNGDAMYWATAVPINIKVSVIPESDDDLNLSLLLEANRAGRGKRVAGDSIDLIAIYPNGNTKSLLNGRIMEGMPVTSVAGSGRMKTKEYMFTFENKVGA